MCMYTCKYASMSHMHMHMRMVMYMLWCMCVLHVHVSYMCMDMVMVSRYQPLLIWMRGTGMTATILHMVTATRRACTVTVRLTDTVTATMVAAAAKIVNP